MQRYLDSEISISYNPTNQQFIEIEAWLFVENKKKKVGLYKNLNFVKSAFDTHQIAVITYKSMTVTSKFLCSQQVCLLSIHPFIMIKRVLLNSFSFATLFGKTHINLKNL